MYADVGSMAWGFMQAQKPVRGAAYNPAEHTLTSSACSGLGFLSAIVLCPGGCS
jgi:hypothetical protein